MDTGAVGWASQRDETAKAPTSFPEMRIGHHW